MKKYILLLLLISLCVGCTTTPQTTPNEDSNQASNTIQQANMKPDVTSMRRICEFAVYEAYYHNVAKFYQKDASGVLFWKKDKHFWVEYSGTVKIGIDVSLMSLSVDGNKVTIELPQTKVLGCNLVTNTLNPDSFILAKDSAKATMDDGFQALEAAQKEMENEVSENRILLETAQDRIKGLLQGYVDGISNLTGKQYYIEWIYLDGNGNLPNATATPTEN